MRPRKRDRHLPACVYSRHGAYWYVKAGQWTRLGATLQEALSEYARRQSTTTGSMGQLIEKALDARKNRLSDNTWRHYQTSARWLSTVMVEFHPEDVMPRHIAQIRQSLSGSPGMANRALSVLRVTFSYAVENQLIDSDPTLGIKRLAERARERLITPAEFAKIRNAADPRLRVIMDLCYLTAQRISDVLAIRYADLLDDGIVFRQAKTGARLIVRWTPELRAIVDTAKSLHGNVRALTLLHTHRGTPPSYSRIKAQWDAACKAASVADAHLHDLRAMAGTAAQAQGLDPQRLLGHTSPANTKRYLRSKTVPVVNGPSIGQVFEIGPSPAKKSSA